MIPNVKKIIFSKLNATLNKTKASQKNRDLFIILITTLGHLLNRETGVRKKWGAT